MRSSLKMKRPEEKSLVARSPIIACDHPDPDNMFTVFRGSAKKRRRGCFSSAYFTRVSRRIKLSHEGRRGGRNQWKLRLYLRLRGIEPAGYRRRWSPRSFSEKKTIGLLTQATCVRANYLTLPSRKTKVCISNTGSRITRTLGTVRNADNTRDIR